MCECGCQCVVVWVWELFRLWAADHAHITLFACTPHALTFFFVCVCVWICVILCVSCSSCEQQIMHTMCATHQLFCLQPHFPLPTLLCSLQIYAQIFFVFFVFFLLGFVFDWWVCEGILLCCLQELQNVTWDVSLLISIIILLITFKSHDSTMANVEDYDISAKFFHLGVPASCMYQHIKCISWVYQQVECNSKLSISAECISKLHVSACLKCTSWVYQQVECISTLSVSAECIIKLNVSAH